MRQMEVAGLRLGSRAEPRPFGPSVPRAPSTAPRFAWQPGSFWSRRKRGLGTALPAMPGLEEGRKERRNAEAAKAVLWALLPGRRPTEQRGRVTFQELGSWSARADIQPIFFCGVGGRLGVGCQSIIPIELG